MIPDMDFLQIFVLQFVQPFKTPPLVGVDNDQLFHPVNVNFIGEDNIKGCFMGGEELSNIAVYWFWYHSHGSRVEQGCSYNRGQGIEICVFVRCDDLHFLRVPVIETW